MRTGVTLILSLSLDLALMVCARVTSKIYATFRNSIRVVFHQLAQFGIRVGIFYLEHLRMRVYFFISLWTVCMCTVCMYTVTVYVLVISLQCLSCTAVGTVP